MKSEFLKNLGITEQSVIDQIMAENGRDISKAKGDLTTLQTRVGELENDLKTANTTITNLQTKADSVDGLNQKISQLETDKTNLTNELNTKVTAIKKTYAIENGVRDAKARNVKAVMALLDESKITYENDELGGLSDQLETLKNSEDTSFLFGEVQAAPVGTHPATPPTGGATPPTSKTLADAVSKALGKQN